MKTFESIMAAVISGVPYRVDFEKRTLKIGDEIVEIDAGNPMSLSEVLKQIECLYVIYKHSIPSTTEPSRPYFKALKYDQLSQDDKTYAPNRDVARFELEYFVLKSLLNGSLVWDEPTMGKWFWRSQNDMNLIILRSWVEVTSNV